MLNQVFDSWRLRWHSIKHNGNGYVKQFQEKENSTKCQNRDGARPRHTGPAV